MKLGLSSLNCNIVVVYSCQCDPFMIWTMRSLTVSLEFTRVLFVKLKEFIVHCRWTSNQVSILTISYDVEDFSQAILIMMIDIIHLVNSYKSALL